MSTMPLSSGEEPDDTPNLDEINNLIKNSSEDVKTTLNVLLGILKDRPYLIDEMRRGIATGKPKSSDALLKAMQGPYYKEVFAEQIIPALDFMIANGQDFKFPFANFPTYKPDTIKARIYQSICYACHHLDPSGKYTMLYSQMQICIEKKVGVFLRLHKNLNMQMPLLGEAVGEGERVGSEVTLWENDLQEFLTTADPGVNGIQFVKQGINLDAKERDRLTELLNELKTAGVRYFISSDTIRVIKMPVVVQAEGDADGL